MNGKIEYVAINKDKIYEAFICAPGTDLPIDVYDKSNKRKWAVGLVLKYNATGYATRVLYIYKDNKDDCLLFLRHVGLTIF